MPSPTKRSISHCHSRKEADSGPVRTPSPIEHKNRSRKRKWSGKSKRRKRSYASLSSKSSNSEKSGTGASGFVGPGLQGSQNVISKFDPNDKSQTMKNWLAKTLLSLWTMPEGLDKWDRDGIYEIILIPLQNTQFKNSMHDIDLHLNL
ncbi:Uncharacterized protein OBRU01_07127 [Operophtera brumata]|uniref:Uncharacterized protein n=1 Tax=Operophtera brumata TaxID=104452 RepID=A0A0L7LH85_OPEBR|nr:Uncharacterized protein OBRU01_07127 [Operophtera brumata]